ncbi:MAG: histidine phosphatase family protein [Myxococcota bacterium]
MRLLLACSLLAFAACGDDDGATAGVDAATDAPSAGTTVYYVVRHTERDPGMDPPINAEGEVRAVALADRLEAAGIDEVITTQFIRGQQSGQPLADRLSQTITVAPFEWRSWTSFAEEISAWQVDREVPGQTYLMIGHSGGYNSTLLRGLGAEFEGTRGERYEDLVVLTKLPDGTVTLESELYGGPSSLDP